MRRLTLHSALLAGTTVILLGVNATPAQAADQRIDYGGHLRGRGGVYSAGYDYWACDTYSDGTGVRTEVRLSNDTTDVVSDTNGSAPGCGHKEPPGHYYAREFRTCWGSACLAWAPAF
jgi:hypothetical protein